MCVGFSLPRCFRRTPYTDKLIAGGIYVTIVSEQEANLPLDRVAVDQGDLVLRILV